MKFFISLIIMLLIHTSVSQACYTDVEAEAEQGLRIHSELLVIALTCSKMDMAFGAYNKYERFTVNNSSQIAEYEAALIEYFKEQGSENPEKDLHNLRSFLANDISTHSVKMGTQTFCEMFLSRLNDVIHMSPNQFRRWSKHAVGNNPSTEPKCTKY